MVSQRTFEKILNSFKIKAYEEQNLLEHADLIHCVVTW